MTGNRKAAKRKVSFVLPVPDALLHQGNYVRNGISAVLSKPFCKDRHQSLHVEGHDIRPIAFRHAIAIQNRCKDMLKHPFVDDVHTEHLCIFHRCTKKPFMRLDITEAWR